MKRRGHTSVDTRIELVVDDERCDPAYEQQLADQAREQWETEHADRALQLEQERTRLTLGERLDTALRNLAALSTVAARPMERTSKSADHADGPPRAEAPDVSPNITVIKHHLRKIEDELDTARGLLRPRNVGLMTTQERDNVIWQEFKGVRAEDVASAAPYLGTSARTIMRARKREAERRKVKVNATTGIVTGNVMDGT